MKKKFYFAVDNDNEHNQMPSQNLPDLIRQIRPTNGFLLRPQRSKNRLSAGQPGLRPDPLGM